MIAGRESLLERFKRQSELILKQAGELEIESSTKRNKESSKNKSIK